MGCSQTEHKLHIDLMRKVQRQPEMIFGDAEGEGRGNAGEGGGGFVEVILMLFTSALVLSFARAQKGSRT